MDSHTSLWRPLLLMGGSVAPSGPETEQQLRSRSSSPRTGTDGSDQRQFLRQTRVLFSLDRL